MAAPPETHGVIVILVIVMAFLESVTVNVYFVFCAKVRFVPIDTEVEGVVASGRVHWSVRVGEKEDGRSKTYSVVAVLDNVGLVVGRAITEFEVALPFVIAPLTRLSVAPVVEVVIASAT